MERISSPLRTVKTTKTRLEAAINPAPTNHFAAYTVQRGSGMANRCFQVFSLCSAFAISAVSNVMNNGSAKMVQKDRWLLANAIQVSSILPKVFSWSEAINKFIKHTTAGVTHTIATARVRRSFNISALNARISAFIFSSYPTGLFVNVMKISSSEG